MKLEEQELEELEVLKMKIQKLEQLELEQLEQERYKQSPLILQYIANTTTSTRPSCSLIRRADSPNP